MKAKETHTMKDEELVSEVQSLRSRHFELKSQAVTEKLENPRLLSKMKKDIARLLTEQRSRQLKGASA